MQKHSKIFVAGYRGLVGSALLRKLRALGYSNIAVGDRAELDLRERRAVDEHFAREKPEYVFLAAAKVGGILANETYKAEFIYDNIAIASNVIDASYRNGVKKLLNLGSSCIYPKLAPQPLKEDYLLTGPLEPTNEPYAIAKIAAIKMCRYYNEQYGTNFLSVMPTNLYGPGDNFNLETSHVLPALIRKFHLAKLLKQGKIEELRTDIARRPLGFGLQLAPKADGKEVETLLGRVGIAATAVELWGTGSPLREFLYVDDLTDAVVFLMSTYDYRQVGEFVNIGAGKDLPIKELAERIRQIVGFAGEIRFDSSKPDGTPRKLLDVSRMRSLGWEPKIGLEQGIKLTYESYLFE
ncbi:MAG: GDP-L-fucose synthase [Ignavibacteria bacterium]|nr:GDP-L-fucose synthase [Ignavibacteria bacterium]